MKIGRRRQPALFLGITTYANTAVITAYMIGLAAGSLVWGRVADRRRDHLCLYALLEAGIGVYAAIIFPDFMGFFFPDAHADIAWARGYQFLDKELQQVVRDAELGRRFADTLAQVWRQGGEETWVLVHVEVQGQQQAEFAERMYVYNYRLFDRYRRHVVSLAVLADEQAGWRPQAFGYELWGCRAGLVFPAVKLLDYRSQSVSIHRLGAATAGAPGTGLLARGV